MVIFLPNYYWFECLRQLNVQYKTVDTNILCIQILKC